MFSLTLPHQSPEQAIVGSKLARDINKKERKKERGAAEIKHGEKKTNPWKLSISSIDVRMDGTVERKEANAAS